MLIKIVLLFLLSLRWVRWLALAQQKEYRLDRLHLFLQSAEGKQELARVIPQRDDLQWKSFKRPKLTPRVMVVAGLSGLLILGLFWLTQFSELVLLAVYLTVPIFVVTGLLPTELVKLVVVTRAISQARAKLAQSQPLVIGITGSYGKTTTKYLIAQVLRQLFSVFFTPQSFNTKYSVPVSINQSYQGQEIAIIEYAAYTRGEIKELATYFQPHLALITGLTPQHLGLFGSIENIIQAKAELIHALPDKASVFCNGEDRGALKICEHQPHSHPVIQYSGDQSEIELENIHLTKAGYLAFTWENTKIETKLAGVQYAQAIAAAIAVAQHLQMPPTLIKKGLEEIEAPNFFINYRPTKKGQLLIDDGKTANPRGFEAALELVTHFKTQGYYVVLLTSGLIDLADQEQSIHQQLAEKSATVVDEVWYAGIPGAVEFKQVFKDRFHSLDQSLSGFLVTLPQQAVILIEGSIPKRLLEELE